jgi:hypothetical protein
MGSLVFVSSLLMDVPGQYPTGEAVGGINLEGVHALRVEIFLRAFYRPPPPRGRSNQFGAFIKLCLVTLQEIGQRYLLDVQKDHAGRHCVEVMPLTTLKDRAERLDGSLRSCFLG